MYYFIDYSLSVNSLPSQSAFFWSTLGLSTRKSSTSVVKVINVAGSSNPEP